jgi:hypothetical protein
MNDSLRSCPNRTNNTSLGSTRVWRKDVKRSSGEPRAGSLHASCFVKVSPKLMDSWQWRVYVTSRKSTTVAQEDKTRHSTSLSEP